MKHKFTPPSMAPEGHKYQTVNGLPARLIASDLKGRATNLVFVIEGSDCEEVTLRYPNGKQIKDSDKRYPRDIIDKPKIVSGWVNVYRSINSSTTFVISPPQKTKRVADHCASVKRIACVKIEFEEGDGLE